MGAYALVGHYKEFYKAKNSTNQENLQKMLMFQVENFKVDLLETGAPENDLGKIS